MEVSSTRKLSRTPAFSRSLSLARSLSRSLPGFFLGRVEVCTLSNIYRVRTQVPRARCRSKFAGHRSLPRPVVYTRSYATFLVARRIALSLGGVRAPYACASCLRTCTPTPTALTHPLSLAGERVCEFARRCAVSRVQRKKGGGFFSSLFIESASRAGVSRQGLDCRPRFLISNLQVNSRPFVQIGYRLRATSFRSFLVSGERENSRGRFGYFSFFFFNEESRDRLECQFFLFLRNNLFRMIAFYGFRRTFQGDSCKLIPMLNLCRRRIK